MNSSFISQRRRRRSCQGHCHLLVFLLLPLLMLMTPLVTMMMSDMKLMFISALPTGAPDAACDNQRPHHYMAPNTLYPVSHDGSQYELKTSDGSVISNTTIITCDAAKPPLRLTLRALTPDAAFRGFMASFRSKQTGDRLGTFTLTDSSIMRYTCTSYCWHCAVTHTSRAKKSEIELEWWPPTQTVSGDAALDLTIVRAYNDIVMLAFPIKAAASTPQ